MVLPTNPQEINRRLPSPHHSVGSIMWDPRENGRDRLPERDQDPNQNGYVLNCIHDSRPLTLNDIARPVFVNHYYAGEPLVPVTNKKLIRLEECDVSTENSVVSQQPQGAGHEFPEHSRNSLTVQQQQLPTGGNTWMENLQERNLNRGIHSKFPEHLRESLRIPTTTQKEGCAPMEDNSKGTFHNEFREPSRHSLGTLNVGRSRMQAADRVDPQQVPLTGYENYRQEFQTYPVARDPMTVQPSAANNVSDQGLLDLPNVNVNLLPPLTPQVTQSNQPTYMMSQPMEQQAEVPTTTNSVSSSDILESIQSIVKVMQQQIQFSSKMTEQGIIQNASLFQEMIKAQEKRDLDPALLAIPTFSGEPTERPQCLDWVSRFKNICDQSGLSFQQELINKSGILVQNFIRSLSEQITNKDLTEKLLQFFSDVPTTSHALNKLQMIRQGSDEPIVNYNQRY